MNGAEIVKSLETRTLSSLARLPVISFYVGTRGWPFVLSWGHRIAGVFLVVYLYYHIYTLGLLATPGAFEARMRLYEHRVLGILEWALGIPVIFHALNGGRLILYESFGNRDDETLVRWALGLSALYVAVLGLLMLMGDQNVSAVFFWVTILAAALTASYGVASRVLRTENSLAWKLQRISGAFLLLMIPAHLLFMHLSPAAGKEAEVVITRMRNAFIKFVDLGLVLAALYHAGYGLFSVALDYLTGRALRRGWFVFLVLATSIFAYLGVRLTLFI